jgi:hypothetical protein
MLDPWIPADHPAALSGDVCGIPSLLALECPDEMRPRSRAGQAPVALDPQAPARHKESLAARHDAVGLPETHPGDLPAQLLAGDDGGRLPLPEPVTYQGWGIASCSSTDRGATSASTLFTQSWTPSIEGSIPRTKPGMAPTLTAIRE